MSRPTMRHAGLWHGVNLFMHAVAAVSVLLLLAQLLAAPPIAIESGWVLWLLVAQFLIADAWIIWIAPKLDNPEGKRRCR